MNEYSRDEVEEILRRALESQPVEALSHEDLVAAAVEAGIDAADVEAAARQLEEERELAREEESDRRRTKETVSTERLYLRGRQRRPLRHRHHVRAWLVGAIDPSRLGHRSRPRRTSGPGPRPATASRPGTSPNPEAPAWHLGEAGSKRSRIGRFNWVWMRSSTQRRASLLHAPRIPLGGVREFASIAPTRRRSK